MEFHRPNRSGSCAEEINPCPAQESNPAMSDHFEDFIGL
jgi:hypothetical protein